jgi:hypothetical protein
MYKSIRDLNPYTQRYIYSPFLRSSRYYVRSNRIHSINFKNKGSLTVEELKEITKDTVLESTKDMTDFIPGDCTYSKKEWCVKRLTQVLETFDNYIPVVGMFLDNPIVDDLEEQGVRLLVDWAWNQYIDKDPPEPKETTM